ncbi:MAG: hypothetical protein IH594_05390, partial [Bacteroidales bacterium]|nr:hypothetical protein [Bacteroidales bacterium]
MLSNENSYFRHPVKVSRVLLSFFLFWIALLLPAQNPRFHHYAVDDGLAQSVI